MTEGQEARLARLENDMNWIRENARAERTERERALARSEQRFEEFVRRYEARHQVIVDSLTMAKGATMAASATADRNARRTQVLIGVLSILASLVVLLANHAV